MMVSVASIVVPDGRRPVRDPHAGALATSMGMLGQIHPITITAEQVLIDGLHRLRAAQALGWSEITATVRVVDDVRRELIEIDANLADPGTVLERASNLARSKRLYEALNPETRKGGYERTPSIGKNETISSMPPPAATAPPFAEVAATKLGSTPRTVQYEVQIATKIAPDVQERIRDTDLADSKTDLIRLARLTPPEQRAAIDRIAAGTSKDVRSAQREQKREDRTESIANTSAPPSIQTLGTFPVIYADPPWRYQHAESESRAIENQYPTMEHGEICALPVAALATKDAVLFMWTTSPKLLEGMDVIAAWGFEYRTCIVWDKERIGMGYWARQQHELLLIATRGAPPTPAPADRPASVFRIPRPEKHSSKPPEFREMIERMFPKWRRIELFAREAAPGWSVWGNQAPAAAAS